MLVLKYIEELCKTIFSAQSCFVDKMDTQVATNDFSHASL